MRTETQVYVPSLSQKVSVFIPVIYCGLQFLSRVSEYDVSIEAVGVLLVASFATGGLEIEVRHPGCGFLEIRGEGL